MEKWPERLYNDEMQATNWLATPLGRRCLAQEQRLVRRALDRVFGEQLLQIGAWGPHEGFLRHARTQRRFLLDESADSGAEILSRLDRLAIAGDSIDAILLPHTLERTEAPHAVLREAARVLRPDGWLVALGFLPSGLFGLRHFLARGGYPAGSRHLIRERRLHDWLELLSFDVDPAIAYCHTLPLDQARVGVLPRESLLARCLPVLAAGYLLVARKRTVHLTPIRPSWQRQPKLKAVAGLVKPTTRSSERSDDRVPERAVNS